MPDGKELCVSESVIKNFLTQRGQRSKVAEGVKFGQA